MSNFISEFKQFAMRGNVIDLAVAVVIGTAFGKITSSLVDSIIMPSLGIILGGVDFTDRILVIGESTIRYGVFIQSVVEFILIALAIFVLVKVINKLKHTILEEDKNIPETVPPPEEVLLLREIRDNLQKTRL
jgi:large conductance mechanosensitive channel